MKNTRFCLVLLLAILLSFAVSAPAFAAPADVMPGCNGAAASRVIVATNAYRASLGLSHLTVVPKLNAFAAVHAGDMARNDILTHSSSSGQSFAERAHSSTYAYASMRENVAVEGPPLPVPLGPNLWSLWRNSPAHDANMRAADVSQIGVAVAPGTSGCYASMDLGGPRG